MKVCKCLNHHLSVANFTTYVSLMVWIRFHPFSDQTIKIKQIYLKNSTGYTLHKFHGLWLQIMCRLSIAVLGNILIPTTLIYSHNEYCGNINNNDKN